MANSSCVALLLIFLVLVEAELINQEVNRVIDLKSHLVKVTTTVTLKNDVGGAVSNFKYTVDPLHVKHLAYISFYKHGDESHVFKMMESDTENKVFVVTLPSKLSAENSIKYVVEEVYAHAISPFPKEISQSQNQLLVYRGNHFYYSPYVTVAQSTSVELPSNTVESYSKFGNPNKVERIIKYGPSKEFENIAAHSQSGMKIHYENNSPFLAVSTMTRVIEVSHWGNIAVEEFISVRHTGAKLKGSFSRYDYQRTPNSGTSAVNSFKTLLPASAFNVYYRDEIGNISTSNLHKTPESVDFEIRPRFPLFGGWKTSYYIGYNLPSYNYLYTRGDLFGLKMRFLDHVMDDQIVDDFTLKVILPEGAKNINAKVPFPVARQRDELHHTYLDTVGRPVIVMKRSNLLEQHIEDFTLSYTFNRFLLLQEPLLIVGAFFLLFFTVIIAARLDFSIAYDQVSDFKMKVNGIVVQVQEQQAKRTKCYKAYQDAIAKYKMSKNHSELANAKKLIEKGHKEATNTITPLITKLRDEDGGVADKVDKLNQLDASLKDKIAQKTSLAEKLIGEKMSRNLYLDQDGKLQKSIDSLQDQVTELVDNLAL